MPARKTKIELARSPTEHDVIAPLADLAHYIETYDAFSARSKDTAGDHVLVTVETNLDPDEWQGIA